MFQGMMTAASAQAAEPPAKPPPPRSPAVPASGLLRTSGTTKGTLPLAFWSAATSASHLVKKPATSMLKLAVREKTWASPVQPRRSSRCGQSVGTSRKLPFWPQRMLCWSWFSSGFEVSKRPVTLHVRVDDDAGEALVGELAGVPLHSDITEALEAEVGLVDLLGAAPERVRDELLGRPEVGRVDVAVLVQNLEVAKLHGGALLPFHRETHAAHQVLPHVHDLLPLGCREDLHGADLLDAPHRGARGGHERGVATAGHTHGRPVAIVKRCRAPAGLLESCVVRLAHVDVRQEDGARSGLPAGVGAHGLHAAVGVLDADLTQERHTIAVHVAVVLPREEAPVPAVSQRRPGGILPRRQKGGHVVGLVLQALAVARPARRHQVLADTLAVQLQLVDPVARDIGPRRTHGALHVEGASDEGCRPRHLRILVSHGLDPLGLPVTSREEPHLEEGRRAPGARRAQTRPTPAPASGSDGSRRGRGPP